MSDTVTVTLVEFLSARLTDDVALARQIQAQAVTDGLGAATPALTLAARVLRDVDAKRAIVTEAGKLCTIVSAQDEPFPFTVAVTFASGRVYAGAAQRVDVTEAWEEWAEKRPRDYADAATLRRLAAVYSDHPAFQDEWRP